MVLLLYFDIDISALSIAIAITNGHTLNLTNSSSSDYWMFEFLGYFLTSWQLVEWDESALRSCCDFTGK